MLQERTLQHLLLSVARSLEEVPENQLSINFLRKSCESLQVVRKSRGPFEVSIFVGEERKTEIVDKRRFRFHERGDVPSQVQLRSELPDARTYNWEQATQLWEELLETQFVRTRGLAPTRFIEQRNQKRNFWLLSMAAIAFLLTEHVTNQVWPTYLFLAWIIPLTKPKQGHLVVAAVMCLSSWMLSGLGNPILALFLIMVSLHAEHLGQSTIMSIYLVIGSLLVSLFNVTAILLILVVMSSELIVSLAQKRYPRLLFVVGALVIGTLVSLLSIQTDSTNGSHLSVIIVLLLSAIVVVMVFPYSTESNLLRVSAPISLTVSVLFLGAEPYIASALLVIWLFKALYRRNPQIVDDKNPTFTGTPVSLRKR